MLLVMLKQVINNIVDDIEPIDIKIATGCLLYSYLESQESKIDLRNKALSFKNYYYSECVDRKIVKRTIGFINIERIVRNKKFKNLNDVSQSDYEEILKWYNNTELEVKFDPKNMNPKTYGKISFSGNYEKNRFKELHENFLRPISNYYKNKYNIDHGSLRIVEVSDTVVPAKEIKFFIVDYPSSRIAQDIKNGSILFSVKPSAVKITPESYIHMII